MSYVPFSIWGGIIRISKKCSWKSFYLFLSKGAWGTCAIYDCYAWLNVTVLVTIGRKPLNRHPIITVETVLGILWDQKCAHRKSCEDFCHHFIKCKSKIDWVCLIFAHKLRHTFGLRIFRAKLPSDLSVNHSEGNDLDREIGKEANNLEFEHRFVVFIH